jgi:hypothetical protein
MDHRVRLGKDDRLHDVADVEEVGLDERDARLGILALLDRGTMSVATTL